ncbi:OB-fold protein [Luteibaculum oceani]|uniref:tRNA_anti-like n=1 Tax=Luteibaculum oceani TaxID=1294296 RepID=A0A5C6V9T1_9FLAO|nr:hypothetical protein [Luteibaculum oceani]TXC81474.1 hypothetical protein FRX97_05570 [Luteibaculum oceani]
MPKKIFVGIAVVLSIGILAGAVGFYLYQKEVPSLADAKPAATLTAEELYSEFETSESAANEKYLGKVIEVSGKVVSTENRDGNVSVLLSADSDLGGVQCSLDSTYREVKVKVGDELRLKCQCNGMLFDVALNRCVIKD